LKTLVRDSGCKSLRQTIYSVKRCHALLHGVLHGRDDFVQLAQYPAVVLQDGSCRQGKKVLLHRKLTYAIPHRAASGKDATSMVADGTKSSPKFIIANLQHLPRTHIMQAQRHECMLVFKL
jgi:hypothetical protein